MAEDWEDYAEPGNKHQPRRLALFYRTPAIAESYLTLACESGRTPAGEGLKLLLPYLSWKNQVLIAKK
jgi:hypothetical protein